MSSTLSSRAEGACPLRALEPRPREGVERSQLRWFLWLGCLLGGGPGSEPGLSGGIISHLTWDHLRTPQEELERDGWVSLLDLLVLRPQIRGRWWMAGSWPIIVWGSKLGSMVMLWVWIRVTAGESMMLMMKCCPGS